MRQKAGTLLYSGGQFIRTRLDNFFVILVIPLNWFVAAFEVNTSVCCLSVTVRILAEIPGTGSGFAIALAFDGFVVSHFVLFELWMEETGSVCACVRAGIHAWSLSSWSALFLNVKSVFWGFILACNTSDLAQIFVPSAS